MFCLVDIDPEQGSGTFGVTGLIVERDLSTPNGPPRQGGPKCITGQIPSLGRKVTEAGQSPKLPAWVRPPPPLLGDSIFL